MGGFLQWLFEAKVQMWGSEILWREVVGVGFGLAGAVLGMRRNVWTWPVGAIGNVLLFTVYVNAVFGNPQARDLYGQAGRQVFFLALAVYGWAAWLRSRRAGTATEAAVVPRWATGRERLGLLVAAALGWVAAYFALRALDSWGPAADAWILVGSLLATYGMARGWSDFWLIWIAVDAVGVPLAWSSDFKPTAVLYGIYGAFCVWGLFVWLRASRTAVRAGEVLPPRDAEPVSA